MFDSHVWLYNFVRIFTCQQNSNLRHSCKIAKRLRNSKSKLSRNSIIYKTRKSSRDYISFQGQTLHRFSEFKFGPFGESERNARFESAMSVRGWRNGIAGREDGRALICRNHEERRSLPWRNFRTPLSELAHPAKESRCPRYRRLPALHPLILRPVTFSLFFFSFFSPYFSFYAAGLKPKVEPTGEKSKSLARGSFLPIHAAPSSRETSSAKCPTKIGICREYRIPEVRSGLRVELLKVLPRPSNFVSPYRSAFPRIFPPAASLPKLPLRDVPSTGISNSFARMSRE